MRQDPRFRFLGTGDTPSVSIDGTDVGFDPSSPDGKVIDAIRMSIDACGEPPFAWGSQEQHFIRHAPKGHVIPYLVYRYKMSVYPQQRVVSDFPLYLLIEPASPCNLRCVMCFQTDKEFTKKSAGYMGYMDIGLYRDIIDQASEGGTRAITLASRGEPTLHKELPKMLRYAADKGTFFDIKLNTNGTLLDDRVIHGILDAGVSIVVVSVDSIEPQQYSQIRVRGDFSTVLANVERFVRIRENDYPGSRTEIRAAGVNLHNPAYGDQDEVRFAEFWGARVDTVAMADAEERWDTYNNSVHPELTHACGYVFERMYVWWNGIINPCDVDYKSQLSVGKVGPGGMTIKEAWHSEAYQRLRQAHIDGKRSLYNPCDRCGV